MTHNLREYLPDDGFSYCALITSFLFATNFLLVFIFMKNRELISIPKSPAAKPEVPIIESKPEVQIIEERNNNKEKARLSIFSILIQMWDLCLVRLFLTMSILMARYVIPILTDRAFGPAKSGYVTSFTALAGTVSASIAAVIIPKVLDRDCFFIC